MLVRESDLRLLEQTELEILQLDELLAREAWQDDKVRLVMSIPGIDYTVAQTCASLRLGIFRALRTPRSWRRISA